MTPVGMLLTEWQPIEKDPGVEADQQYKPTVCFHHEYGNHSCGNVRRNVAGTSKENITL